MMDEKVHSTEEKKTEHTVTVFEKFPKNVRQIGVPLPGKKIYIEDYVMTYMKQAFEEMQDSRMILLLGKRGTKAAAAGFFIYGAVALEVENTLEQSDFSKDVWDKLYQQIHQHFSGAQIIGWACAVSLWNSEMDRKIKKIHKDQFGNDNTLLFLHDISEKEEKLFFWEYGVMKELPGYYIFFEKNIQMQDFMLVNHEPESIDADYEDAVTNSVRQVITEKEEEKKKRLQMLNYGIVGLSLLVIILGANMLAESTTKINDMEKTVDALSQFVSETSREGWQESTVSPAKEENKEENKKKKKTEKEEQGESQQKEKETKVPIETAAASSAAPASKTQEKNSSMANTSTNQMQSYIVQKGDTLNQILWNQYHTVAYADQVRKLNKIKDEDRIYIGQCLFLPKYLK